MKEVLIDGYIGYDWWTDSGVTLKSVQEQLKGLEDSEDIKVTVNSAGGSVYEGIVIFNHIRDLAKNHTVSVYINCLAMSMGLYIALAPRTVNKDAKITIRENSIAMAHNPWGYTIGDYREFQKTADYFEKLAALYGLVLTNVSGKPEKEIRDAMDEETFYVGREIFEIGFANDIETISETSDGKNTSASAASVRSASIANARFEFERVMEKEAEARKRDPAAYRGDLMKAVALYKPTPKPPVAESTKTGGKNNLGGLMTPEELKAQNKALYDAIFAQGETAGTEKERARVNAHLLLGEKSGSLALAAKHIKAGVPSNDETVQAEYFAAKMDGTNLDARNKDNVGDIQTGGEAGGNIDDAKLETAFLNGTRGRDTGGKAWAE